MPLENTIEVNEGETVTDLQVISYGNGRIRGQVQFEGGDLPKTTAFMSKSSATACHRAMAAKWMCAGAS
ncbi:MAG: hypothetical protein U0Y68_03950 [Blastocatellia bacterium]